VKERNEEREGKGTGIKEEGV
jgi:hypothetical protein